MKEWSKRKQWRVYVYYLLILMTPLSIYGSYIGNHPRKFIGYSLWIFLGVSAIHRLWKDKHHTVKEGELEQN